jgi:hypothetical protein
MAILPHLAYLAYPPNQALLGLSTARYAVSKPVARRRHALRGRMSERVAFVNSEG